MKFQSTRPYGARLFVVLKGELPVAFQSTRPYGARQLAYELMHFDLPFQSTRPYGARPTVAACNSLTRRFNPRARTGRDLDLLWSLTTHTIVSIHAPVRGATIVRCVLSNLPLVSIHAPVRGATRQSRSLDSLRQGFNPRARTGRDVPWRERSRFSSVSIHAPVRGATEAMNLSLHFTLVSIHAPVRGATCTWEMGIMHTYVSIHAPVRGATFAL